MKASSMALVFGMTVLAGCAAQPQPYVMKTKFNPDEVAWSTKPGTASIEGQAFLKTRGGDVKTCAGNIVALFPSSTYAKEMFYASWHGAHITQSPDPRARTVVRHTRCDAEGKFQFTELPAGKWIISTNVIWEAAYHGGHIKQGGGIAEPIRTFPDKHETLIMAEPGYHG